MFFIQPSVLLGMLGLSIPIVIHLIARQKRKKVVFSSLRFLRASQRRVGRTLNLHQFLLLLLRMLILASLVLAFARPLSPGGWFKSLLGAEGRQVVLLVDNSYSMGALSGTEPLINRARKAATAILDSLRPGSRIAAIAFERDARPLTAGWTTDRADARQAIEDLNVSAGETNIASAFSLLAGLLKNAGAGTREFFLLTDLQKSGWTHVERGEFDEANLRFTVVDCGASPVPNAAIETLELSVTKTLRNAPAQIRAKIRNYSESDLSPRCSLFAEKTKIGERRLFIPAGGSAEIQFEFTSGDRNYLAGYLALSSDGLELDNRRYFCTRIPKSLEVIIVDPQADGEKPSSHYLSRALRPPEADISVIKPKIVKILSPEQLTGADIAILTGIAQFPGEGWLEAWVRDGGKLVVFSSYAGTQKTQSLSIPTGIHLISEPQISNEFVRITRAEGIEDSVGDLLVDTQFFQRASLAADLSNPSIYVRAWFNDGQPAVVQKKIDEGTLLYLAIPCGARWTDFPLQIPYLPFVHEMMALTLEERNSYSVVGNPLWFVREMENAEISRPDRSTIEYDAKSQKIPPIAERPGIYRASMTKYGITEERAAAVNIAANESDPEKLSARVLKELIPGVRVVPVEAILDAPARNIGLSDWTDVLLVLALVLILTEFILAGRFAVPASRRGNKGRQNSWTR